MHQSAFCVCLISERKTQNPPIISHSEDIFFKARFSPTARPPDSLNRNIAFLRYFIWLPRSPAPAGRIACKINPTVSLSKGLPQYATRAERHHHGNVVQHGTHACPIHARAPEALPVPRSSQIILPRRGPVRASAAYAFSAACRMRPARAVAGFTSAVFSTTSRIPWGMSV